MSASLEVGKTYYISLNDRPGTFFDNATIKATVGDELTIGATNWDSDDIHIRMSNISYWFEKTELLKLRKENKELNERVLSQKDRIDDLQRELKGSKK